MFKISTHLNTLFIMLCAILYAGCSDKPATTVKDHIRLSQTYLSQGKIRAAVIEARNALQAAPDNAHAHLALAQVMMTSGDAAAALQQLEKALNLAPDDNQVILLWCETAIKTGQPGQAHSKLTTLHPANETEAFTKDLLTSQALLAMGQPEQARQLLNTLLEQEPDHADALLALANTHFRTGQIQTGREVLLKAARANPDNMEIMLHQGHLALIEKNFAKAEQYYAKALEALNSFDTTTRNEYIALNGMFKALVGQEKTEEAMRYSGRLAASPQGKLLTEFKDALSSARSGDLDSAENQFKAILDKAPAFSAAQSALGLVQFSRGELKQAESSLLQALSQASYASTPGAHTANKLLAITQLQLGKIELAQASLTKALERAPEDADLTTLLGITHLAQEDISSAQKALTQSEAIIRQHPQKPYAKGPLAAARFMLALQYFQKNQLDQAQEAINAAVQLIPDDSRVRVLQANIAFKKEGPDKALSLIKQWILDKPDAAIARETLALTYQRAARIPEAIEAYKDLLAQNEKNLLALNNLAWLYFEQGNDRAKGLAEKAYNLAQEDPYIMDTYGWILAHSNSPEELSKGISLLEQASTKAPDNEEIRKHHTTALERAKARPMATN